MERSPLLARLWLVCRPLTYLPPAPPPPAAEAERGSEDLRELAAAVRQALRLPEEQAVSFSQLRDVLMALKGNQLPWPPGVTPELYRATDVAVGAARACTWLLLAWQARLPQPCGLTACGLAGAPPQRPCALPPARLPSARAPAQRAAALSRHGCPERSAALTRSAPAPAPAAGLQAVHHETAIYAPVVEQGLLPQEGCDRVVRLSIGPLIWRLLDNMRRAAGCRQRRLQPQREADAAAAGTRRSGRRLVGAGAAGAGAAASSGGGGGAAASGGGDGCALKLALFSGHDTTLMPLLVALGHRVKAWPPFVAHVELELWGAAAGGAAVAGGAGGDGGGPERAGAGAGAGVGAGEAPPLLVAARYNGLPIVWPSGGGGAVAGAGGGSRHPHFISLSGFEQLLRGVQEDQEGHERSCRPGA
jgi:hypothetical protein